MGVSTEQYRAAIGLFMISRGCKTQPLQERDMYYDEPDHDINWSQPAGRVKSTSWKLNAILLVTLVTTMLAKSCMEDMLLISGIEPNPGPAIETAEQKEQKIAHQNRIIAELSVNAPNEIRDCIRLYNPAKEYEHHYNKFKAQKKATLMSTLNYLKTPIHDKATIRECSHELICTIGTYLPDICRMCDDEFTTKLGETPLITCAKCGQGIHRKCILDHLKLSKDDDHNREDILDIINPTKLPGLRYLCGACDEELIPSTQKQNGNDKKFVIVSDNKRSDTQQIDDDTEEDEDIGQTAHNTSQESLVISGIDMGTSPLAPTTRCKCQKSGILKKALDYGCPEQSNGINRNVNIDIEQNTYAEDTPPICRFYRQNRCRHKNPKDCNYSHPRPCKKLLLHGTKPQRGCTLGKECNSFHPIMCRESLSRGTCYKEDCNKPHVKGTKRTPNLACKQSIQDGICLNENCKLTHVQGTIRTANQINPQTNTTNTANPIPNHSTFLDELKSLKLEMLQAMDNMITNRLGNQLTANANIPYSEIVKSQCQREQPETFPMTCRQTSMQPGNQHFHRTLTVH